VTIAIASDLHLGTASGRDLLLRKPTLAAFVEALAGVDELVLLGDAVELRETPVTSAVGVARPVLEEIGAAMAGGRVTIVPGNHDHQLADALLGRLRMRGTPLSVDASAKPPRDGPFGAVARALGPAEVRVAYPGVWVRDDVFATHGHYLDLHNTVPTFERIAIGAVQRVVGGLPEAGSLVPDDYERAVAPVYALTYSLAQSVRDGAFVGTNSSMKAWQALNGPGSGLRSVSARVLGGVVFPGAVAALNRAGLGPFKADLSGVEMRRAGLRAIAETLERLGIEASYAVFGHTHRSGPHPEDSDGWTTATGTRLVNTGSWIHEPAFLGEEPEKSPYWPGHMVMVNATGPPELRRLLTELPS
jgi:UDP-2,3-diacylglucosamine pyrophosphatase LpxH